MMVNAKYTDGVAETAKTFFQIAKMKLSGGDSDVMKLSFKKMDLYPSIHVNKIAVNSSNTQG